VNVQRVSVEERACSFFSGERFFCRAFGRLDDIARTRIFIGSQRPCGRLPDQGRNESGVIVVSDTSSDLNAFVALRR